jgi:hypothetical protein
MADKIYIVGPDMERVVVDPDLHEKLNLLARRFYAEMGCEVHDEFDFSESSHPTELLMYNQALLAHEFHLNIGLD